MSTPKKLPIPKGWVMDPLGYTHWLLIAIRTAEVIAKTNRPPTSSADELLKILKGPATPKSIWGHINEPIPDTGGTLLNESLGLRAALTAFRG